jgi:hypothetical protein
MPLCAGLLAVGAAVAFGTLRQTATSGHALRAAAHGWLMEPPLASRFVHHRASVDID